MGISGLLIHVQVSGLVDHPRVSPLGHIQISRLVDYLGISRLGRMEICGDLFPA